MPFTPEKLREAFDKFPKIYLENFKEVWDWKTDVEHNGGNVLDPVHLERTHSKLFKILNRWQTYRNGKNPNTEQTLKDALSQIQVDYNQIRKYSLLSFSDIPKESLKHIWDELGRVKEDEGKKNEEGKYYAIATTKPMLLLWGQTPAFDREVRRKLPPVYQVTVYDNKMTFDKWYNALSVLSSELNDNSEFIEECQRISEKYFPKSRIVPYGRLLDIYYWV